MANTNHTHPTLNLNGTHKDDLMEQALNVHKAARALRKALQEATPNGRDYQTAAQGDYEAALEEHSARHATVNNTIEWAASLADHLYK